MNQITVLMRNLLGALDALITAVAAGFNAGLVKTTWTDAKAGFVDAAITGRLGSIKAIHRGVILVSGTSATATIPAVVVGKSILMTLGVSGTNGGSAGVESLPYLELTNSTTITATRIGGGVYNSRIAYQLVEFN